jgi:hypothetical protein
MECKMRSYILNGLLRTRNRIIKMISLQNARRAVLVAASKRVGRLSGRRNDFSIRLMEAIKGLINLSIFQGNYENTFGSLHT